MHHRLVLWLHQKLRDKPQSFDNLFPQFLKEISGWDKDEGSPDLADLLTENFLCYGGTGDVPAKIVEKLKLDPKDARAQRKARTFWYVPGWKPEPDKAWPERLNSLRRSLGMDFMMFALELGVPYGDLRSWFLGESVPGGHVAKLVEILERDGMEATSLWRRTAHLREGR